MTYCIIPLSEYVASLAVKHMRTWLFGQTAGHVLVGVRLGVWLGVWLAVSESVPPDVGDAVGVMV